MAGEEFFRRGVTQVHFLPTIASATLAPTAAEVTAGDDLTPEISDISGFTSENSPIPTPKLDNTFTGNIPGEDTAADSVLTFDEQLDSNPLYATLAKGTDGYLAIFYKGTASGTPAAADKCEVFPVRSSGPRRVYSMANDPARWNVPMAITAPPAFDVAVLA